VEGPGRLNLRFEFDAADATTRLHVQEQRPPLQVVRAFTNPGAETLVHLHNVSGGILAGDRLEMEFSVGPQANAQIATTGATRVYRCADGETSAVQRTTIRVEERGLLEYLPDPVIPFAQSRYAQETDIHLEAGATLFWWESIAPGRQSSGELFAYDRLHVRTAIHAGGRTIVLENYLLEPARMALDAPSRLGPYAHMTTFYICQAGCGAESWRELENLLSGIASGLTENNRTLWGVSALGADGVAVRGLSVSGVEIASHLREFWRAAKKSVTGRDAVMPRKLG
jgi:urease accessory protein